MAVAKRRISPKIDVAADALYRVARGDFSKINDDVLRLLVQRADAAMAREHVSLNDAPNDRLFGLLMARIDALQADRDAYVVLLDYIRTHPPLLRTLAPALLSSMGAALDQAQLSTGGPRGIMQSAGLLAVYMWTLRAWQKDTKADLPATMRALDQGLRRAAQAAAWIGL